jgi:hemerythrin superfamily protein
MTTGASADAIELLAADHRAVEQLFRHLAAAGEVGAVENQRDLAQRIVRELSVHAAVEEQVLYPAVRTLLPEGDRLADTSLEDHAEVKRALADLDGRDPSDDGFEPCAARLAELVRSHVAEEEGELFPALQAAGRERLQELATALERARKVAPTRPHPHVPDRPPANIVLGAVAAVADRARDAARSLVGEPQS